MNRRSILLFGAAILAAAATSPLHAQTSDGSIKGSGSTFAAPLYKEWNKSYFQGGAGLKFNAIGSGGGISEFQNQATDFAGSDVPMSDSQIAQTRGNNHDVMHIPTAYGGIVLTYNLPGNPRLNLTADDVAKIYSGQIRKWNDQQLVDHNPGLRGVDYDIVTFHRAEGSGTTFGFTSFLTAGSADWRASTGADFSATWPVGDGREGNNGVVQAVERNLYSIGYADYNVVAAELAKAQRNNTQIGLGMAALSNSATRNGGTFVLPTLESIGNAVASAAQAAGGNDLRLNLIYAPGSASYPLATATYIVVHQHQAGAEKARAIQSFLLWGVSQGQEAAAPLGYVPLPAIVQQQAARLIRSIDGAGQR